MDCKCLQNVVSIFLNLGYEKCYEKKTNTKILSFLNIESYTSSVYFPGYKAAPECATLRPYNLIKTWLLKAYHHLKQSSKILL